MVHRIQNRNPGYSEFASTQNNIQLNSIRSETIPNTSGANALKLDPMELKNTETEMFNSMVDENMALNSSSLDNEVSEVSNNTNIIEDSPLNLENQSDITQDANNVENSNGLENFELSEDSPQLFNSDSENIDEKIDGDSDKNNEEDELEIPAFLRRQKN